MVCNSLNCKGLAFFLLYTVIRTVPSFLVYSSCGQTQIDFESLLDAKGKYIWIWLVEEIVKVKFKYQCRCTWWLLQLVLIIC